MATVKNKEVEKKPSLFNLLGNPPLAHFSQYTALAIFHTIKILSRYGMRPREWLKYIV